MNVGLRFVSNGDRVPSVVYEKKKGRHSFPDPTRTSENKQVS